MSDREMYSTIVVRGAADPISLGVELLGGKICAASVGNLVEANIALEAECERLRTQCDAILLQARCWAGEAKAQQSITREVGAALGGIPTWGPIAAGVEAMRAERDALAAENARLRAELEAIKGQEPDCDRSACGDFSPGRCDNPDCSARRDRKPALPAAPEGGEV